jgi:ribosomal protein S27AE
MKEMIIGFITGMAVLALALWKKKHDFGEIWTNKELIQVDIKNKPLKCFHCGLTDFSRIEGLVNTTIMMFFRLGFLNLSAVCYKCGHCGYLHWFVRPEEK